MGREYGLSLSITEAARQVNSGQRELVVEKLLSELKTLKGRTIALLGLAFKPHTDDLRESPALALAELLLKRGAFVRAHDPVALPRAKREVALPLDYAGDPRTLLKGADAVVLATDWPEYRTWPWGSLKGFSVSPSWWTAGTSWTERPWPPSATATWAWGCPPWASWRG